MPNKSVRIIQKACDGLDVIRLPVRRLLDPFIQVSDLLRTFEDTVAFFPAPVLHSIPSAKIQFSLARIGAGFGSA